MTNHTRGILAVTGAALLWSSGGLFIKLLPPDSWGISLWRSVGAIVVFALLFRKSVLRWNPMMLLSAVSYAGMLMLFVLSTKLTTAANAIILQYTAPIYVLLAEPILFKVRLRPINIITVILCGLGMYLCIAGGDSGSLLGNILGAASGLCFGAFLLSQRANSSDYHAGAIFWGNVIIVAVCAFLAEAPLAYSDADWLRLMYLGLVQIGLAYTLFTVGLRSLSALEASLLTMLEPILNPLWVLLGYGEAPAVTTYIGGALVLLTLVGRRILLRKEMPS